MINFKCGDNLSNPTVTVTCTTSGDGDVHIKFDDILVGWLI